MTDEFVTRFVFSTDADLVIPNTMALDTAATELRKIPKLTLPETIGVQVGLRSFASATMKLGMGLEALGLIEDQKGPLMTIRENLLMGYAGFMIFNLVRRTVRALAAIETSEAIIETAFDLASIVLAWKVPIAVAAAAMCGAWLGRSFSLGKSHSKTVHLPTIDINVPHDRRIAAGHIRRLGR